MTSNRTPAFDQMKRSVNNLWTSTLNRQTNHIAGLKYWHPMDYQLTESEKLSFHIRYGELETYVFRSSIWDNIHKDENKKIRKYYPIMVWI